MKKFKMLFLMAALVAVVSVNAVEHTESLGLIPVVKAPELSLKGKYVLVYFWATSEKGSLKSCLEMNKAIGELKGAKIELIAIWFEPLRVIYDDMAKESALKGLNSVAVDDGIYSEVYRKYKAYKGLGNYLLDQNGMVIAKDLTPADLAMYIKYNRNYGKS